MELNDIIYNGYTLEELLIAGAALFIGLPVLWAIVKRLFKKQKKDDPHRQTIRCDSCGWQGQISRYAGKCPKCSEPLGDQKAKGYRS